MNFTRFSLILCFVVVITSCKKEPQASFTMSKSSALTGEPISFINSSTDASGYFWDFGDGNSSEEDSPTHIYTVAGVFTVTLTASGDGGTSTTNREIAISYPDPVAGFSLNKTQAEIGETISFTNLSENTSSYHWDFGDGTESTDHNPTHIYESAAEFMVTLTATGEGGTDTETKAITIVYPEPVASFSADKKNVLVGETISFTNLSEHAISYSWDFGDGNTSSAESPTYAYQTDGEFIVTLTSTGEGGSSIASDTIIVVYPEPTAGFTVDKTTAEVGENITFTNISENANSYQWDFGDGKSSTQENPTHIYEADGTFLVTLTATGNGGTAEATKEIIITYPEPVAGFTVSKTSALVGESISFTNTSEHANSYQWSFGDGKSSTQKNPTHIYEADGTYTVTLTATGNGGTAEATREISVTNPVPVAGFNASKTTVGVGESILFTNTSEHADSYQWGFGDGSSSQATNPTHTYQNPGSYTVTLTAYGYGENDIATKTIYVEGSTDPVAGFDIDKTNAMVGELITFTNTSQNATSYQWEFGDGGFSTQVNPTHSYSTEGTYEVILRAINESKRDEIKKSVTITNNTEATVIPGVRIGPYYIGSTMGELAVLLDGQTYSHSQIYFLGTYYNYLEFNELGIGLALVLSRSSIYTFDIPNNIYAYEPFDAVTEKGIVLGSTFVDVIKAYGEPDNISSFGTHSYSSSLGISFSADDSETYVDQMWLYKLNNTKNAKTTDVSSVREKAIKIRESKITNSNWNF